jgi:hypothetical protein
LANTGPDERWVAVAIIAGARNLLALMTLLGVWAWPAHKCILRISFDGLAGLARH